MRKTKIICTIGPASDSKEIVSQLIRTGMDASRHNFSHGNHEEHEARIKLVRETSSELKRHIAIILDTKGPEIRTGKFKGGTVDLKEGTPYTVVCNEEILGDDTKCSVSYKDLYKDVKVGDVILIADGLVGLEVENIDGTNIKCKIRNSGTLGNNKNVNVPGVITSIPAVTEKDIKDLKFGIKMGVDMIAASFIRKADDVLEIRNVLKDNGGENIQIFSKIENHEGVDNIDEIIEVSDGIMVARGDLGVEMPVEEVPVIQKMIIEKCNKAGKPVITATQMLDSMTRNPRPTRAEASDVANAILDGTDAIMLSGETANGKYPVETVETMAKIAERTEETLDNKNKLKQPIKDGESSLQDNISLAACNTAITSNAKAIIAATQSGKTARSVSKYRPKCPIIAVTPYEEVARGLSLNWGVIPMVAPKVSSTDELIDISANTALEAGLVRKGDLVVIATGVPVNISGSTNTIKFHYI